MNLNLFKIDQVVRFAAKAHIQQNRKGDEVPFITHPFTAAIYAMAAMEDTSFSNQEKEDIVQAILLHDVVEDTPFELKDLIDAFGENVTRLVSDASEHDKTKPWKERKQHTIDTLAALPLDSKFVICADKTHNVVSLSRDLERVGDEAWNSFKKGKEEQKWYYESIAQEIGKGVSPTPLFFQQYQQLVRNLF